MNKILSCVRLDFYTIKPYRKTLLIFLALAIVMMIAFQSMSMMCFYLMMSLVMIMVYPFSIGETNRLDTLYSTLSIKRGNIVIGRYAFAFSMEAAVVMLILVISWIISLFTDMEFNIREMIFYICVASLFFTVMVAFQYPLYFKLGYNKAKYIAYIPLLLIVLVIMLIPNLLQHVNTEINFDDFFDMLLASSFSLYLVPVIAGHLIMALSCVLSCKLYKKRDI